VQEEASHALLDGCNAVFLAPTAGGKTEASIFPLLAGMVADEPTAVGTLYVAPIKALLNNQAERLKAYAEMVGLRRFLWHGDTTAAERRAFLREPAQILMTTPESLEVMLLSGRVPHQRLFSDLRAVVVDEIHAMLLHVQHDRQVRAYGAGPCKTNLKNIANVLEMWATDHHGRYPVTLAQLTGGEKYLRSVPTCSVAGRDTYSETYESTPHPPHYRLGCSGHNHADVDARPGYPQYDSIEGLIDK
jgi:hypothetical protein